MNLLILNTFNATTPLVGILPPHVTSCRRARCVSPGQMTSTPPQCQPYPALPATPEQARPSTQAGAPDAFTTMKGSSSPRTDAGPLMSEAALSSPVFSPFLFGDNNGKKSVESDLSREPSLSAQTPPSTAALSTNDRNFNRRPDSIVTDLLLVDVARPSPCQDQDLFSSNADRLQTINQITSVKQASRPIQRHSSSAASKMSTMSSPAPSVFRSFGGNEAWESTVGNSSATEHTYLFGIDPHHLQKQQESSGQSKRGLKPAASFHNLSLSPSSWKRKSARLSDLLSGGNHSSTSRSQSLHIKTASQDRYLEGEGSEDDGGIATSHHYRNLGINTLNHDRIQKGYDGEFRSELEGEGGNGIRHWYDNFHGIDWQHDIIKQSLRRRRLRDRKRDEGVRGIMAFAWDGLQGWILITIVGVLTASIAYMIITMEMVLFDLKEGFCSTQLGVARRFCCPSPPARSRLLSAALAASAAYGTTPGLITTPTLSNDLTRFLKDHECKDWVTWGRFWQEKTSVYGGSDDSGKSRVTWWIDYGSFIIAALIMASLASTMTIYLTSSTSVYSSKDSPSVPHPGLDPDFPAWETVSENDEVIHNLRSEGSASARDERRACEEQGERSSLQQISQHDIPSSLEESFFTQYGTMRNGHIKKKPLKRAISHVSLKSAKGPTRQRKVMYFAAGSGIPELKTILSGFVIRGYLGSWTLATKCVGLTLSVASGLSLGKEGPFVHIASCVGNIASRFFPKYDRNEAKRREVISAACAAGVAVSFGAPIGGTLFSLEEVSYFFPPKVMWRSFFCAMMAAFVLKLLNPFGSGKIVLFEVTYTKDWHTFELAPFLFLGIFGGVYGALFCKANIWWTKNIRNSTVLRDHPIIEVVLVTLTTVFISFSNPLTKMGGTELVASLFSECHQGEYSDGGLCVERPELAWKLVQSITLALLIKAMLTVVTFGIKLPAGIFIPTLAVGACTGRITGLLFELLHHSYPDILIFSACPVVDREGFGQKACIIPGVWAMVGAASALAGVTRTTVSLAVIMLYVGSAFSLKGLHKLIWRISLQTSTFSELTGTLSYTVPVMLGILVAKTVADAIEPRSIYDLVIELSDLPYLDAKTEYVHDSAPLDIVDMDAPFISLDDDNTLGSLRQKLLDLYKEGSGGGFPILACFEENASMYGYIAAKELEYGLSKAYPFSGSDTPCTFKTANALRHGVYLPASRVSTPAGIDLSAFIDLAPIVVNQRSPMELCHELFSKLGVRYLVVVDGRGSYGGVIERNRYLAYLKYLDKQKEKESVMGYFWKKPIRPSA